MKILIATANPFQDWNFSADREIKAIQDVVDDSTEDSEIGLRVEYCVEYVRLPSILSRHKPDVLHLSVATFLDRGLYFDDVSPAGSGAITGQIKYQEAEQDLVKPSVTFTEFASDLKRFRNNNLRCVVFTSDLSSGDAKAFAKAVDGVSIGWPLGIENDEAIAFVRAFYAGLVLEKGFQYAIDSAMGHLRRQFPASPRITTASVATYSEDLDLNTFMLRNSSLAGVNNPLIEVKDFLTNNASDDDLRDVCFELSIDYEAIAGDSKRSKVINLITYCQHRNLIEKLKLQIKQSRPDAPWQ